MAMKIMKKIISKIPITTYSRKVDPIVREIISINKLKQIPIIIIFRHVPDSILISRMKRLGLKVKYIVPFVKAVCGKLPVRNFATLSGILEIEKIYYDGKALLMDKPTSKLLVPNPKLPQNKNTHLSGKGVTVAFIDSGVYPHPDLTKPTNRIIAFKDFIKGMDYPYDDNGHGTACIGAGFGASIDGKFKSVAYDSCIVCTKAFDEFGTGFYSDILAAMQWILDAKEQYNIKIIVLPFGTSSFTNQFDLLSCAAQRLWDNGLFVSTSAGNMGPHEGTITSPGICTSCFTSGACSLEDTPPTAASFSSRGPVPQKIDKPDVIMPGHNVTTLNADTSYNPLNKAYYDFKKSSIIYKEASGTSISSSLSAAAAALVFQINDSLAPQDVKSILRTCTMSINELKIVQGTGMIDVKKLEEL
jgi:serine protease AprX